MLWEGDFMLDELLKQRAHSISQLEIEGVLFNLLPLLQLIDDKFLLKS